MTEANAKEDVEIANAAEGHLNEYDDYNCAVCKNKGYTMRAYQPYNDERWATVAEECKCMSMRRSIRNMKKSGLQGVIKEYTFSKFEANEAWQETVKRTAQEYAENPDGWFFIGGQSGAGKTHICTAICRHLLLSGRQVVYMLWRDEVVKLKSLVTEADEYSAAIDRLKNADVLYIDDLFKTGKGYDGQKQKPTAADVNLAFEILNNRYCAKRPTVISSECTIDDVIGIDEAVGGRIAERAKAINLSTDRNKNHRLKCGINL